jgi:hypothetical protein
MYALCTMKGKVGVNGGKIGGEKWEAGAITKAAVAKKRL